DSSAGGFGGPCCAASVAAAANTTTAAPTIDVTRMRFSVRLALPQVCRSYRHRKDRIICKRPRTSTSWSILLLAVTPFQPDRGVGPYEVIEPLGSGGMAQVWKARDTRLGRIVALKRITASHVDRFQQEARAIAALNHPHICQIHDVGPDYLVLE